MGNLDPRLTQPLYPEQQSDVLIDYVNAGLRISSEDFEKSVQYLKEMGLKITYPSDEVCLVFEDGHCLYVFTDRQLVSFADGIRYVKG